MEKVKARRSKNTGRIRNLLLEKEVLFTLRANDNFLIPAKSGAELLHEKLEFPKYRIVIDSSVEEFASRITSYNVCYTKLLRAIRL